MLNNVVQNTLLELVRDREVLLVDLINKNFIDIDLHSDGELLEIFEIPGIVIAGNGLVN